jgi:hypothetical protein
MPTLAEKIVGCCWLCLCLFMCVCCQGCLSCVLRVFVYVCQGLCVRTQPDTCPQEHMSSETSSASVPYFGWHC